ncbi:MAG: diguanylate cyclase [Pseudomonadota bacterium]|nr:diguanylate cyclase [Pseudomonadota bacterium]MDP1904236.1 diguanylate cyclase [Pseudomonadota bacterium]MDP2354394.1 diguanylate cyclase [Pseudomonadota bacterium]
MLPRYRNILIALFILFALAFLGLVALFHNRADDYAVGEAKNQALNALLVHRAIHSYVTKIQRPEIYRLQGEGKLYPDYFSPLVMSFTFISRNIKDLLNLEREKHALEPIYFKLASENPRNPVNQADAVEVELLRRMNTNELKEYQKVVELEGQQWLYLAVPIGRSNKGCMKCHGDPADAPADMVAMYGDKAGFHESPDAIRALISIRVSLANIVKAGDQMAWTLSGFTFVVLSGIYLLLAFLIRRIDTQERKILSHNIELARLSMTDMLTGVYNRVGLQQHGVEIMKRADRFHHPVAVLLLDLDHFKQINDQHGHAVGDTVLARFADTIKTNLRGSDIFGRWGGEEFLVISPHLNLGEAMKMAEKLRHAIENTEFSNAIHLTTSVGVSEYQPGETDAALFARADQALYRAKSAGRNRVAGETNAD